MVAGNKLQMKNNIFAIVGTLKLYYTLNFYSVINA